MSKSNELTQQIIKFIFDEGGYAWRNNTMGVYDQKRRIYRTAPKKGVSDVLGLFKGRFVAVEVKIGRDKLSPEQSGFLKNINHYGGIAMVAKDIETFKLFWKLATD